MSTPKLLGLPAITPDLKPIIPYLQRAEEVKVQEPIVAYWCAYYAAQVGIGIKARDAASRDVLFTLLGILERTKSDIGSNDAINVEAASAAYVENFALKVFSVADNEDRKGHATRITAKKFLAAANFLEVLKTFPKTDVSESNGDKIRYAKWKAADIAKAFREGRKPAPGPPGYVDELSQAADAQTLEQQQPSSPPPFNLASDVPRKATITRSSPSRSPPRAKHGSPPPIIIEPTRPSTPPDAPSHLATNALGPHSSWGDVTPVREDWSTAATPGTAPSTSGIYSSSEYGWDQESPTRDATFSGGRGHEITGQARHVRSGSGSSYGSRGGASPRRKAWINDEGPRTPSPPSSPSRVRRSPSQSDGPKPSSPTSKGRNVTPESDKKVHFTPSVVGGSLTTESTPTSPIIPHLVSKHGDNELTFNVTDSLPTTFPNMNTDWSAPQLPHPPPPPVLPSAPPFSSSPARSHIAMHLTTHRQPIPAPPLAPQAPIELTPHLITKVQKHCRFAISSLDYEDADTARKELRAALALLEE